MNQKAYAIKNNIKQITIDSTDTSWNVGSFDSDGEIRSLVLSLYPDVENPYRTVENLINKGLEEIEYKMNHEDGFDLIELMEE